MDALSYLPFFLTLLGILALASSMMLMSTEGNTIATGEENKGHYIPVLLMAVLLALWMGMRPVTSVFGDTINYALIYASIDPAEPPVLSLFSEWGWDILTYLCKLNDLDVSTYFTIVAFLYVLTGLWAVKRFVPTSPWLGMLFLIGSAFFFPYGTNGLRNGLACNLTLMVIAYALDERYTKAVITAILAVSFHKSVLLPLASAAAAMTFIKKTDHALVVWIASIIFSLFFSGFFTSLVSSIGIDDRLSLYLNAELVSERAGEASVGETGFRWDFLAFSAIPIAYIYYINSRGVRDGWFNVLSVTYLLSNSFWILLIRATFSNRFAYLSWFLMPVIFVYPLCNMRAWQNQNHAAGIILLAYVTMTIIVSFIVF